MCHSALVPAEQLEERCLLSGQAIAGHDHRIEEINSYLPVTLTFAPESGLLPGSAHPNAVAAAESFLLSNAHSQGFESGATLEYRVSNSYVSEHTGVTHVYLQQTLRGIDVLNAVANVNVLADGSILSAGSSFIVDAFPSSAVAQAKIPGQLSPDEALSSLAHTFGLDRSGSISGFAASSATVNGAVNSPVGSPAQLSAPAMSHEAILVEPVYVPVKGGVELGWRINLQTIDGQHWYDAAVSASDGEVLVVADWASHAQYEVFALPKESPADGGRTLETDPHHAAASPFGWHDTNGVSGAEFTITRGNNVHAYTDIDANNVADSGSAPNGGALLNFMPALDLNQPPANYRDAAVVNLFYWNNILHDIHQRYGFTEAAGNFQVRNYSGTGFGNDYVRAEAQDGSGVNNANMLTPPDGSPPRMQMFVWTAADPDRDSDLDNGIIIHEYGHGVSNRLTGGPANASALSAIQSNGMGEGWSDWWALMLTQDSADSAGDGRGIGPYALGEPATGAGIRTQQYSYDFNVNNHTFSDVVGASTPHLIGEVWATTLWDLNWALIEGASLDPGFRHAGLGFDSDFYNGSGGNHLAMQLVMDGLKLQPANPTLLQARDAILQADQLLTGGSYQDTIWKVFARRGMGVSAQTLGGSGSTNVIEAFDFPIDGSIPFERNVLPGSLVSVVQGPTLPLSGPGDRVTLRFFAEKDSRTAFTLTPAQSNAALTVKFLEQDGTTVFGPFTAPNGQSVEIAPQSLPMTGNYKLEVTGTAATAVSMTGARNAALEEHVGDTTSSRELTINNSRINPGVDRRAVIGTSEAASAVFTEYTDAAKFVDISGSGTALNLFDDGEATITTTIGNSLFPSGQVTIGNNGAVLAGPGLSLPYINTPLDSFGLPGLYPFWDDLDDDTGNVYWIEQPIEGIDALVVQWDKRPRYPNIGAATFQLQLFESGPTLARFVYKDVTFAAGDSANNGASATVGIVNPSGDVGQFSFNTGSLAANKVIDVSADSDVDEFEFSASAGQKIDVVLAGIGKVDMSSSTLRIYETDGTTLLATGTTRPLSGGSTVANYDKGAIDVTIPATGTYTARVVGKVPGDYVLVVTRGAGMEVENSNGNGPPRRMLQSGDDMLGMLSTPSDPVDRYLLPLSAGEKVLLRIRTPYDHGEMLPLNTLQPLLQLRFPDGTIAQSDRKSGPGGIPQIVYTATSAGTHRIDVRAASGTGEYILETHLLSSNLIGGESNSSFGAEPELTGSAGVVAASIQRDVTPAIVSPLVFLPPTLTIRQPTIPAGPGGSPREADLADAGDGITSLAAASGRTRAERTPFGVTLRFLKPGLTGRDGDSLSAIQAEAESDRSRTAIDMVFADPLEVMAAALEF